MGRGRFGWLRLWSMLISRSLRRLSVLPLAGGLSRAGVVALLVLCSGDCILGLLSFICGLA